LQLQLLALSVPSLADHLDVVGVVVQQLPGDDEGESEVLSSDISSVPVYSAG
jgi:hypothetical protein